ncbi:MAG: FkbM family methyltransferase [Terriglobales bacterium]
MKPAQRKAAFVLAATDHGPLILNRFDYKPLGPDEGIGVGYNLLLNSSYDSQEVGVGLAMLDLARNFRGAGVVAVDCGANLGVMAVEWARAMTGWGRLLAFEAQERIFYALAGNLALNNCFNAEARHAAVGATCGTMRIPIPDYLRPGSFGSLELHPGPENEFIGQEIDYATTAEIACVTLDSLGLERLDLLKIDVERMELEVLEGARECIRRCRPMMIVESLKSDQTKLQAWLESAGYAVFAMGANFVAVHQTDPARPLIRPTH